MNELLIKVFDFGIRVIELANYLNEENKQFPMIAHLLECGTGIGVCLRISDSLPKSLQENFTKAYKLALETEYLLELMVKTEFISDNQSKPILNDCRYIIEEIARQLSKKVG
jgi:four helix bundle protein